MNYRHHFDISAAVVKQLGEELVSDEVTALIELIKNAYDADATYANVVVDTNGVLQDETLYFSEANGFSPAKGYITIEDDGTGMESEEIDKGWLTISFSHKRKMRAEGKLTPKWNRTPLGDKGLGRLSTQRLGKRLELFTCKERFSMHESQDNGKDKTEYRVAFDWSDFTEDRELTAVPVYWDECKENPRQGTKLVITKLLRPEVWLGDTQQKLVGQLSQLIFPFEEVRTFNVYLNINGVRLDLGTIIQSLREVAVSHFSFSFDAQSNGKLEISGKVRLTRMKGIGHEKEEIYNEILGRDLGRGFYDYLTSPENKNFLSNIEYIGRDGWFISYEDNLEWKSLGGLALDDGKLANPGKFRGEIDGFFLGGVSLDLPEDVFSRTADYRDFVKQHVGVRIYRDGFGIRPYGLNGSDWLNLGGGQTSGLSFYSLRPQNVIGYVSLTARENSQLREKTDREGFIDTPYSRNFFRTMDEFVKRLEIFFNNLGRSYNEYRKLRAEESPEFINIDQFAPEAREITAKALQVEEQVDKLDKGLDRVTESVQEIADQARQIPLRTSRDEHRLSNILSDTKAKLAEARALIEQLGALLEKLKRLEPAAASVATTIETLRHQLVQFSELAGLGLTAEALVHEIHLTAERLANQTKALNDTLRKSGTTNASIVAYTEYVYSIVSTLRKQISHLDPSLRYVREKKGKLNVRVFFGNLQEFYSSDRFKRSGIRILLEEPFDDFTVLINEGKLTQVADNIILNSEYWLREGVRRGEVADPKIIVRSKRPFIDIHDSGMGVDLSVEKSLFQPFVTMKPRNIGRGLGLFIARELLDSSGCSISLLPERNALGRRYIFRIDLTGVINE